MAVPEATVDFTWRHQLISAIRNVDIIGVRLLSRLLPRLLLPTPKQGVRIRTLHGFDLWINPVEDSGVERSIYETGTYERGTLHLMERMLVPGDTFVDIGANIGLMTVLAGKVVGPSGKAIAFEPNPSTRAILERNVSMSGLGQVRVMSVAVGAEKGRTIIYEGEGDNRGRATLVKSESSGVAAEVEVMPLSDLFEPEERVDMVKMDIEGFELEALKGMHAFWRREDPPLLIVECSGQRTNSHGEGVDPIFAYLSGLGIYRFFLGRAGKERISRLVEVRDAKDLPAHDNLYCLSAPQMLRAQEVGIL